MHTEDKKTPLYDWHTAHQAKMENFGGFLMPMWYASAKSEHLAVLTHAGLFDTSHMDTLTVRGNQAYELLQHCFTKDMDRCIGPKQQPLAPGRCVYGAFLDEKGHAVDDAIIFKMDDDDFMVVVNAGMGTVIADHLEKHKSGKKAAITNLSGRLGKIDIQGPNAVRIVRELLSDPEQVLSSMPYFSFKGVLPLDETSAKKNCRFQRRHSRAGLTHGLHRRGGLRNILPGGTGGCPVGSRPVGGRPLGDCPLRTGRPRLPACRCGAAAVPTRISATGLLSTIPGRLPCHGTANRKDSPNRLSATAH